MKNYVSKTEFQIATEDIPLTVTNNQCTNTWAFFSCNELSIFYVWSFWKKIFVLMTECNIWNQPGNHGNLLLQVVNKIVSSLPSSSSNKYIILKVAVLSRTHQCLSMFLTYLKWLWNLLMFRYPNETNSFNAIKCLTIPKPNLPSNTLFLLLQCSGDKRHRQTDCRAVAAPGDGEGKGPYTCDPGRVARRVSIFPPFFFTIWNKIINLNLQW